MIPHFGEYIAFKLNPVASLESLKDVEVAKACEALETKTYVACVTYLLCLPVPGVEHIQVAMTLPSQGLSTGQPDRSILSDMAVAVLPNTSNPLSRPPLNPTVPLPWPDCFHPTQAMTRCRIRNDFTIGNPWPNPKYQLETENGLPEDYCREDNERKEALREEHQPLTGDVCAAADHQDEREASVVTLPLPSEHDRESLHSCPDSIVNDTLPTTSNWFSKVSEVFDGLIKKVSHCVPYTMPVIDVLDDLETVKEINDPWESFRELDALKKIQAEYHERMKAKLRTDIDRTRQKDEELHARLESKMLKREPSSDDAIDKELTNSDS
ncbi:hypothetical protein IW262DRAFT_1477455 [Armillaria fumosa]|nr:hypothetical protein IW262DRAFT_1477455 [Armillaria fumosa]